MCEGFVVISKSVCYLSLGCYLLGQPPIPRGKYTRKMVEIAIAHTPYYGGAGCSFTLERKCFLASCL